jgi:uncharacterized protein (DUF2236 family)
MSATVARPPRLTGFDPDAPEIERMARDAIASSAYYGAANVVMQLAKLPVGRGVAESTVDSGRVDKHPLKRQRTTAQYLIVALLGTEDERRYMRREVNKQHRQVVRKPGESDVPYNAFHSGLQLWVAACIYVGFSYWLELSRGPLTEAQRDAFYARCSRLGTTLQVPEDEWPADREAFAAYFADALDGLEMDDVSRTYLQDLVNVRLHRHRSASTSAGEPSLQARITRPLRRWNRFVTLGFLAPQFRELLHEEWTADDQRRFDRFLKVALWLDVHLPAAVRHALLNVYEHDVKRRIRQQKAIV